METLDLQPLWSLAPFTPPPPAPPWAFRSARAPSQEATAPASSAPNVEAVGQT